jgi:small-conductance mechanosensitive channel
MFASIFQQPLVIGALIAAPVVYAAGLALGRWLKREHHLRLGVLYHLLCLLLAVYLPIKALLIVAPPVPPPSGEAWQHQWIRYFSSAIILLAILFILALFRRFYWQRWFKRTHETEAPKLLQQVFTFAIFTVALTLVLNIRHGQQVDALLAGSGIAAVVLGFAMQETLANIISGIALQISKPFKVGDWLIVEKQRAEVVEMNWRSTRLRTNDDVYLDIPNKTVTSGMIVNLSYPTKTHAHRIRVRFEQRVPPNTVRELLRRAAQNAPGVLAHPPVKVFVVDYVDFTVLYEIKYSLDEENRFNDIEDAIRTNIWYEAQRARLVIPAPAQNLFFHRDSAARVTGGRSAEFLAEQPLFSSLTAAQRDHLLAHARVLRFGRGEEIVHQGDEGCSMFVILEGAANVVVQANGNRLPIASLRAGEAFGEMCLLTGEKRTATVVAQTDCEVWEVDRDVLAPVLQENEKVAHNLSELLAHRKVETEGLIATSAAPEVVEGTKREYAKSFLHRISSLFRM